MCRSCWNELGRPTSEDPAVIRAAEAIAALYDETFSGGALHIVTDDWNLEDDTLQWCHDSHPLTPVEKAAYEALLPLSVGDRGAALAKFEGWDLEE